MPGVCSCSCLGCCSSDRFEEVTFPSVSCTRGCVPLLERPLDRVEACQQDVIRERATSSTTPQKDGKRFYRTKGRTRHHLGTLRALHEETVARRRATAPAGSPNLLGARSVVAQSASVSTRLRRRNIWHDRRLPPPSSGVRPRFRVLVAGLRRVCPSHSP